MSEYDITRGTLKKPYLGYAVPNNRVVDSVVTVDTKGNPTNDDDTEDVLESILTELRIANFHLSIMSGVTITESEVCDG